MSERINSFHDLRVYQEACELDLAVFDFSKGLPRDELAALAAPVRQAARAVGAGLAGAWSKRRQPEAYIARLTDADAALQETRHWLERAVASGYLDAAKHRDLEAGCDAIGRKLGTLIRQAGSAREGDGRVPVEPEDSAEPTAQRDSFPARSAGTSGGRRPEPAARSEGRGNWKRP